MLVKYFELIFQDLSQFRMVSKINQIIKLFCLKIILKKWPVLKLESISFGLSTVETKCSPTIGIHDALEIANYKKIPIVKFWKPNRTELPAHLCENSQSNLKQRFYSISPFNCIKNQSHQDLLIF
ncbi:hypothetical protein BpHYR1_016865 [Brachionus plicatilis]|uniref:Uncharacterized protein n=1 Tax=Brachionus plicatilis TaxID=10195 RepID=A0A3M7STI2_BRAPC|nr:hypothetical protein BpHYR1_016865 [Brachionus plicatilis]